MSATAVIVVEGVLKSVTGDNKVDSGARLYHGLKEVMKVCLVTNEEDTRAVDYWLRLNGFLDHPYLVAADRLLEPYSATRRLKQIARLREAGSVIDFVVEPDPSVAAALLQHGIPALLMAHPRYSKPEFRPDAVAEVTPWNEFVQEIERQQELRALDGRTEREAQ